jgi:hypothetical protein
MPIVEITHRGHKRDLTLRKKHFSRPSTHFFWIFENFHPSTGNPFSAEFERKGIIPNPTQVGKCGKIDILIEDRLFHYN